MRFAAVLTTAATLALSGAAAAESAAPDAGGTTNTATDARRVIESFVTELQGELKAALKEGGPPNAVEVCEDVAPDIATSLSEASGWDVGRTSLKTRNPDNDPDVWERRVLKQFQDRAAAGEEIAGMSYAAVVDGDAGKTYRYMQAIPTGQVCLACHGSNLSPELVETLDRLYPQDEARGFELGDIRGAFTLSKPQ